MSNIHRISDFENNPSNRDNLPLMGSNFNSNDDPRKEAFTSFIKNFCCPLITWKSFIVFITIVDTIMFIISISQGVDKSMELLLPPRKDVLDSMGSLIPKNVRHGEVWRWITYAFLHADFVHLLSNLISRLIIGSFVEKILGLYKTIILYIVTAIGGALFSVMIDPSVDSVGASIAIYGLLGAYIGFSAINWNYLDQIYGPLNKYINIFFILFLVLMNFSYQITNPRINIYGHLGGLLLGFFTAFILKKPIQEGDGMCCSYKYWLILSYAILILILVPGFILFYLLDHYN